MDQLGITRLLAKIEPDLNTGCWLWAGPWASRTGYGRLSVHNRETSAHRYSWQVHRGPIPDGLFVCHRCDTPLCVNPAHLFLGTNAENTRDREAKGRGPQGARNPFSTLTEETVRNLRRVWAERGNMAAEARRLGVNCSAVYRAARGWSWSHVGEAN